jgi:hypothetical protein
MLKYKFILLFLFTFILLVGCENSDLIPAKKFLFDHPNIKLRLNKDQMSFDKYSSNETLDLFFRKANGEILTVYITDGSRNKHDELLYSVYELLLTKDFQRIGETNFMVQYS